MNVEVGGEGAEDQDLKRSSIGRKKVRGVAWLAAPETVRTPSSTVDPSLAVSHTRRIGST